MTVQAHTEIVTGSYVVFDPTGRDLRDCYEVGCVLGVEHEDGERVFYVSPNGTNCVIRCTEIANVL